MTNPSTSIIDKDNKAKLQVKLAQLDINPNSTGPIRNPANPIPDTIEIPTDAGTPFVFPANLNISGITTESPKPSIPKPTIDRCKLALTIKR